MQSIPVGRWPYNLIWSKAITETCLKIIAHSVGNKLPLRALTFSCTVFGVLCNLFCKFAACCFSCCIHFIESTSDFLGVSAMICIIFITNIHYILSYWNLFRATTSSFKKPKCQLYLGFLKIFKNTHTKAISQAFVTSSDLLNGWKHLWLYKLNSQKKKTNMIKTLCVIWAKAKHNIMLSGNYV